MTLIESQRYSDAAMAKLASTSENSSIHDMAGFGPSKEEVFERNEGCPFCTCESTTVLAETTFHQTSEANLQLPDLAGRLFLCSDCGVAFPSHRYRCESFPLLYQKSLRDHQFFDQTRLQKVRVRYLMELLRNRQSRWSFSRLLDQLSLHVFQVPLLQRRPQGLRILDVGCGLGEFLSIFQALGNQVVGTEIVPELVERNVSRGFDCRCGELESLELPSGAFDLIFVRAVFFRSRHPARTISLCRRLLAPGGEIALVDPSAEESGVEYFFHKQFPQGQFYITNPMRYFQMLSDRFGLRVTAHRQIFGRPSAPLRSIRLLGHLYGFGELLVANALRRRPYTLAYNLRAED